MNRTPFAAKPAVGAGRIHELTQRIAGAAMKVHRALGPGPLDSAYQACLRAERQRPLPPVYREATLDCGYRADLPVRNQAVKTEVKAVDVLRPIPSAQSPCCLRLSGCKVGLVIDFNRKMLKDGARRAVDNCQKPPRSLRVLR